MGYTITLPDGTEFSGNDADKVLEMAEEWDSDGVGWYEELMHDMYTDMENNYNYGFSNSSSYLNSDDDLDLISRTHIHR